jgi:hypothetical protein
MQKIVNRPDLERIITELELNQRTEWSLIKNQFEATVESLKPANIIKSSLKEIISAPDLKTDVVDAAIGLTTGFVAKKIIIGKTMNPLKLLLGIIMELAVANKVAKNTDGIKSVGNVLLSKIFNRSSNGQKT